MRMGPAAMRACRHPTDARCLAAVIAVLAMLLVPAECARASGPHSLYEDPAGVGRQRAAGHSHHGGRSPAAHTHAEGVYGRTHGAEGDGGEDARAQAGQTGPSSVPVATSIVPAAASLATVGAPLATVEPTAPIDLDVPLSGAGPASPSRPPGWAPPPIPPPPRLVPPR